MTDEFKRDREVCDKATPGQSYAGESGESILPPYVVGLHENSYALGWFNKSEDARMFHRARTRWPAALDKIDSLRSDLVVAQITINTREVEIQTLKEESENWRESFLNMTRFNLDLIERLAAAEAKLSAAEKCVEAARAWAKESREDFGHDKMNLTWLVQQLAEYDKEHGK